MSSPIKPERSDSTALERRAAARRKVAMEAEDRLEISVKAAGAAGRSAETDPGVRRLLREVHDKRAESAASADSVRAQKRKSRPGDAATDKLPVVNKGQPLFKSGSTWTAR